MYHLSICENIKISVVNSVHERNKTNGWFTSTCCKSLTIIAMLASTCFVSNPAIFSCFPVRNLAIRRVLDDIHHRLLLSSLMIMKHPWSFKAKLRIILRRWHFLNDMLHENPVLISVTCSACFFRWQGAPPSGNTIHT